MRKIFVIGSSNTDMVIRSKSIPVPGETVIGGTFLMNAGGKGANQAVAAAKLGASVTFACKLGNDIFGRDARSAFEELGIHTDHIISDPDNPSGVALILVDQAGENIISVASGANANIKTTELDPLIDQVTHNDIILIQMEIPVPVIAYAVEMCYHKGAVVILNPAPAGSLDDHLFKFVNIISPNETEAEFLTGIRVTDAASAELAASVFHNKGVANVVITLGAKGAYISGEGARSLIPSPVVAAIDTTAAGDIFNGAMAVGLSEGKGLFDSVQFACKAAAISVTRPGAQASAPYRAEL